MEDFVGTKFYCPQVLAGGNQRIPIMEKTLELVLSGVIYTVSVLFINEAYFRHKLIFNFNTDTPAGTSSAFTCIGALGTPPSRTGPLARKYLPGFPYS